MARAPTRSPFCFLSLTTVQFPHLSVLYALPSVMPMLRTHPLSLDEWLRIQSTQTKLNLALSNIDAALFPCSYVVGLRPVCKISTVLDLCLLCWYYTQEHQCPKESQLATALSLLDGNDTFLYAGTGFGKTLAAILHVYLERRNGITIIVTPLTRIQASHVRIYLVERVLSC